MAVLTPWAFGGAPPAVIRFLTLTSLLVSIGVLAVQLRARHVEAPPTPLWPLFGIVALGYLQLVPLPPTLHRILAPGSAEIWHPADPFVAAVLGDDWKPISIHPAATRASAAWGLGLLSLASLAIPALRHRRTRRAALTVVAAGGLAVAVYGVVARVAFGPLLYGRYAVPTVAPFGPFVSKNHFAGYVAMAALLTLGLATALADRRHRESSLSWISGERAGRTIFAFGASAAMVLAVLVSQSRGGALALLVGLLAFGILRRNTEATQGRVAVAMVLAASAAVAIWVVLPAEARQRLATLWAGPDTSAGYRLGLWADTLRTFLASPWLGQGLGAFEDALPRFKTVAGELLVEHAENDYLEVLAEGGLVAGLLAAVFIGPLLPRLTAQRDEHRARSMDAETAGAAAALAALAAHSAFDFNLRLAASAAVAALLVVVALSPSPRGALPTRPWLAMIGLVATAAFALAEVRVGRSATGGPSPLSPTSVRVHLEAARWAARIRTRPADAEAWTHLAWVRILQGHVQQGAALVSHAARLDPLRPSLQTYAERVSQAARPFPP